MGKKIFTSLRLKICLSKPMDTNKIFLPHILVSRFEIWLVRMQINTYEIFLPHISVSRFEIWLVSAHKFFNFELEVVSGPLGRSYHKEEMSKLWEVDYIECLFSFCKKMQKLELSYKEIAMLKCVVLTFAGRFTTVKVSGLEARKLEYSLGLKIKPNDWLLADMCPQAANHWALI